MVPVYIKSTDVGAPTLGPTSADLAAWLKIVMVQIGWSIAFQDTDVVVFRNNPLAVGSSGCYLKVDYSAAVARVWMFKNMSDISYGSEPLPPTGLGAAYIIHKTAYWKVIGDDRTVYFMFSANATAPTSIADLNANMYGFGDYNTPVVGNDSNYFMNARAYNSTNVDFDDSFGNPTAIEWSRVVPRFLDNSPTDPQRYCVPSMPTISSKVNPSGGVAFPNTRNYYLPLLEAIVQSGSSSLALNYRPQGTFRGLYTIMAMMEINHRIDYISDGGTFANFNHGGGVKAGFAISTGEWG